MEQGGEKKRRSGPHQREDETGSKEEKRWCGLCGPTLLIPANCKLTLRSLCASLQFGATCLQLNLKLTKNCWFSYLQVIFYRLKKLLIPNTLISCIKFKQDALKITCQDERLRSLLKRAIILNERSE